MAHRVPNHNSKCKNLHGHRYKIEVGVDDKIITEKGVSNEGMVIDFSDIKAMLMEYIDKVYDHNAVFYKEDPLIEILNSAESPYQDKKIIIFDEIPTAENLAKHWYYLMKDSLKERNIKIKYLKVYETPTSSATYEEKYEI